MNAGMLATHPADVWVAMKNALGRVPKGKRTPEQRDLQSLIDRAVVFSTQLGGSPTAPISLLLPGDALRQLSDGLSLADWQATEGISDVIDI